MERKIDREGEKGEKEVREGGRGSRCFNASPVGLG